MRTIKLKPITHFEFAQFGEILDPTDANPQINYCVKILNSLEGALTNISLINSPIIKHTSIIKSLERRPLSWQSYFPIGNTCYPIIVAHSGHYGSPNLDTLTGFIVPSGIGISLDPKTWRASISSFSERGFFIMIVEEFGTFGDVISLQIDPIKIIG